MTKRKAVSRISKSKPFSMQKFIFIFLAASFAFAFLVGGLYLGKNNQNVNVNSAKSNSQLILDTSNWKTYENKDYGFSFKYPSKFTITETSVKPVYKGIYNEPINRYSLSFSTGKMFPNGGDDTIQDISGFSVHVGPTNGMTINEYYKGLTENGDPWIIKNVTPFGNAIEAADITCYSCSNTTERFGKYFYRFIPFQNGVGDESIGNYMDQIRSTFKFTQ